MRKSQPDEPLESPVAFRPGSNGEFVPAPPTSADARAERTYQHVVADSARRLGISRRHFVSSACGPAAALAVINQVYGCIKRGGAGYEVTDAITLDSGGACATLRGDECVFDVQTHHVDLQRDWAGTSLLAGALAADPQGGCGEAERLACWSAEHF